MNSKAKLNNIILTMILAVAFTFAGVITAMADDEIQDDAAQAQDVVVEIEETAAPEAEAEAVTEIEAEAEIETEVEAVTEIDAEAEIEAEAEAVEVEAEDNTDEDAAAESDAGEADANDAEQAEEHAEEIEVVIPPAEIEDEEEIGEALYEEPKTPVVKVDTDYEQFEIIADEDGNAVISGMLAEFDEDAFGSPSFDIVVDGIAYPVTVDSEGNVYGDLPEGFSIKDGKIYINGVYEDMDIEIKNFSAISGIFWEPEFEEVGYFEPEPYFPEEEIGTAAYEEPVYYGGYSNNDYSAYEADFDETAELAETEEPKTIEEATEEFFFPGDDAEEDAVLGAYSDDTNGGFPGAAAAALALGALAVLAALKKTGILIP